MNASFQKQGAPRIVIAGASSGVGKTTLAVGLMAAFARRGLRVAPFKVGPDYIDPGWHTAACGRPSAPLDTWILGHEGVRSSFARGAVDVDLAIIEGMMGLHDGASADTDRGSTAEVAKLLQAPVILALNAEAVARSAGAMALGYRDFDPEVSLAGVVANRVASEGHGELLRPGITQTGLAYLGWLPEYRDAVIPERHLGLTLANERDPGLIHRLADLIETHLDLGQVLEIARSAPELAVVAPPVTVHASGSVRIGIAQDEAFCFYYPDNLALLEAAGVELVPFSPIHDHGLPERLGGLYLGGGYPELHAEALGSNSTMRSEIRDWGRSGRPIYAECGGFMYLCDALTTADGDTHPMVGAISARAVMESRLQAIGYRDVASLRDTPLGPAGARVRGHEFRHSRLEGDIPVERAAFKVGDRSVGYAHEGVLASYIHLHFGSNPAAAEQLVKQCLATH